MTAAKITLDLPHIPFLALFGIICFGMGVLCAVVVPSLVMRGAPYSEPYKPKKQNKTLRRFTRRTRRR